MPPSVTPASLGSMVVSAITTAVGAAVMTWPAIVVRTRCGTWGDDCTVLVPIMRTDESKYIRELETVVGPIPPTVGMGWNPHIPYHPSVWLRYPISHTSTIPYLSED